MTSHKPIKLAQAKQTQQAFTLVELLLVILVLSSLALATTFLVDGIGNQSRFDETKTRLQQIRQAIIGDTSRTLNGQPELRGYVADMGRLPVDLTELIEIGGQGAWGLSAVTASDLSPVVTISLNAGWRGPYLDTLPDSDGTRRFRDGWGNGDLSNVNYGWSFGVDIIGVSGVTVQSFGADGEAGITTTGAVFEEDYPATGNLIEPNDYVVSLANINVQLDQPITVEPVNSLGNPEDLVLRLYRVNDGAIEDPALESAAVTAVVGQQTLTFNVTDGLPHYMGSYAAVLICDNSVIYDGDCAPPHINTQPYYFTLIPRAQLPVIPWNIQ